MRPLLLLVCAALPLSAQSIRPRLEGRVPAEVIPVIDSIVQAAAADSLPTEPLVQKALEGGAKHVSGDRIVLAVRLRRDRLEAARALLVRAGDATPVTPLKVTAVATALSRGVPGPTVQRVVAGLPGEPHAAALQAVADLLAHKFDPDSSAQLILDAARLGVPHDRFLDVATAAIHEMQRGSTREDALARVRAGLPNLPPPARPAPKAVSDAKRPGV
ncbi:MAG TPA: hypothetical protein VNH63_01315 [Gemmatimonadales bacterium]|nr:hypothetical protein [Gemmatimonadales bacterium]